MQHRVRSRLARWFASRSAADFHVLTRVCGERVVLHTLHLPSGHRFIAGAENFETAAAELTRLIERTFAMSHTKTATSPESKPTKT